MAGNSNSGRKRRPTNLIVLEGRGNRISKSRSGEPKPAGDLCDPPAYFDEEQRAVWRYAIQHAPGGLLKMLDASVLETWVVAYCAHKRAVEMLQVGPWILKTPNGAIQQSPWVGQRNQAAKSLRSAASDLGFSPAARTRISIDQPVEEDPADYWLGPA